MDLVIEWVTAASFVVVVCWWLAVTGCEMPYWVSLALGAALFGLMNILGRRSDGSRGDT